MIIEVISDGNWLHKCEVLLKNSTDLSHHIATQMEVKLERIRLLVLPIIVSRISPKFFPILFLIYSHTITHYSYIIPQIFINVDSSSYL